MISQMHLLWSGFLAFGLFLAFKCSWKRERGSALIGRIGESNGNNTVVLISPMIILWIFLIQAGAKVLFSGIKDGLMDFAGFAAVLTLNVCIYYTVLLAAGPAVRKYFSARACAFLWVLPAAMFICPASMPVFISDVKKCIYIPGDMLSIFVYVWLAAAAVLFIFHIAVHFIIRRRMLGASRPVDDSVILSMWAAECESINYGSPPELLYCKKATTPMSMGRYNDTCIVFLPDREMTEEDLRLIFRHEIRHIQRRDVDTKIIMTFFLSLFWFNPLMWVAVKKASEDLELSCDEIVLENASERERRRYAELILHTAGNSLSFSTCLSSSAKSLRYRLKAVMEQRKTMTGAFMTAVVMFIFCAGYGTLSVVTERGTIGEMAFADSGSCEITDGNLYCGNKKEGSIRQVQGEHGEELMNYITEARAGRLLGDIDMRNLDTEAEFNIKSKNWEFFVEVCGKIVEVYDKRAEESEYYILQADLDREYIKTFFIIK